MRRGRIFFYLAFIIILGLVAVVVVYQRLLNPAVTSAPQAPVPTPVDIVNVIVVTQKVPRGTVLDGTVLGLVPIPRDLFIQGMFTNVNEVDGKLAKFDLDAGIPLTGGMLADNAEQLSGTGSVAALSIPRGMVAVSIPISRLSSVSYAPQAGDHVNVIVTMLFVDLDTDFQTVLPNQAGAVIAPGVAGETGPNYLTAQVSGGGGEGGTSVGKAEVIPSLGQSVYVVPSEKQRPRMVSQNLLQDAVVLKVGNFSVTSSQQLTPTQQTGGEQQVPQGEPTPQPAEPAAPDIITLIVNPQDAITLNYLMYSGSQLTLALRSAEDETRVQTEAVTLQFLLDQYNIPVPVKLPYGTEPRIDKAVPPVLQNDLVPTPVP
jgi:Flp pilus assembly protein CpaB